MNPFKRMMERLGLLRVSPRLRPKLLQPYEDDSGDAAAGGVTARLPKVPPRLSGGNALTIPREPQITEARATDAI
jgi:hypothetical protein